MGIYTYTEGEVKVLTLLRVFHTMEKGQIQNFMLKINRTEEVVDRILNNLKHIRKIYETEMFGVKYYSLTPKPVPNLLDHIDALWVMLFNIENEEAEEHYSILENTIIPKKPCILCYEKGGYTYYILRIHSKEEAKNLFLLEERLYGCGSSTVFSYVKVIVLVNTDNLKELDIPKVKMAHMFVRVMRDQEGNISVERVDGE